MFKDETNMKSTHMPSGIQQNESNEILRPYYVMRNAVIEAAGYISTYAQYLFCSDPKLSYGDVLHIEVRKICLFVYNNQECIWTLVLLCTLQATF